MAVPALLVSVRNLAEAQAAIDGGCDRLDVKEPSHGPLGMADPAVIAEIAAFSMQTDARDRRSCSVALGELEELRAAKGAIDVPQGVTDIKLGPAGTLTVQRWSEGWRDVIGRCEPAQLAGIGRVAVAYADWQAAAAPPPAAILAAAIELGADAFLIDTCRKEAGGLCACLSHEELRRLAATAHRAELTLALAGSLRLGDIAALVELSPDVIAVRGAACRGQSRSSDVSAECVRRLKAEICACFGSDRKAPRYAQS
jgi:(5-formylfuran-3-yl)methyl phosphate synthase